MVNLDTMSLHELLDLLRLLAVFEFYDGYKTPSKAEWCWENNIDADVVQEYIEAQFKYKESL